MSIYKSIPPGRRRPLDVITYVICTQSMGEVIILLIQHIVRTLNTINIVILTYSVDAEKPRHEVLFHLTNIGQH